MLQLDKNPPHSSELAQLALAERNTIFSSVIGIKWH